MLRPVMTVLLAAAVACTPVTSAPSTPTPAPSGTANASAPPDRVTGWRSDIAALIPGMAGLHPDIAHSVTRAQLDDASAALAAKVPVLTDEEVLVGMMRIVGLVTSGGCDAHTGLYVWGDGTYPVDSLPLRLWWFDEGMYVIDALPPYRDLIGMRVDTFNGRLMAEVTAAIDPLVPRDNDATVRLLTPRYVVIPQVLRGLGLIEPGAITLSLTSMTGGARSVTVTPIAMSAYNAWAGRYGLLLPDDTGVLYLSRRTEALWSTELDPGGLLYVQYNSVEYLGAALDSLRAALATPHEKVVVDVRSNLGGDIGNLPPLLAALRDPKIGRLFVVTGRNTFSAASMFVAELEAMRTIVITGEPMGGCPNPRGGARPVRLSYSGLVVMVGSQQNISISADDHRLQIPPTLPARLTPAAWLAKQDPALAAIRVYRG